MILVDFSNTIYSNIFAQTKGGAIQDNDLLRHMVCNSLRNIKMKHGRKYGRMVLCYDSGNPWRREYFPHYKAKRKQQRAETSQDDVAAMFDFIAEIQSDLFTFSPYPCIATSRCEADDIIAVLTKQFRTTEPVLIVSGDSDFYQLHSDMVNQYLPQKNQKVQCENPHDTLLEKIARGDSSDSIPNVLSDDDVFVTEGKRQKPMRQAMLNQVIRGKFPSTEVSTNWDRNATLIDLDNIPTEYAQSIPNTYAIVSHAKYNHTRNRGMAFYQYLTQNKMKLLAEKAEEFMIGE